MLGAVENGDLRVEYFRLADRVAHRILYRGVMIAESIEGTPEQDWPPSPPLQEVHFERLQLKRLPEASDVAFLVGMAGRSHWSATVEPGADGGCRWEIACRLHGPPEWLGVRYRLAVPVVVEKDEPLFPSESPLFPATKKHLRFSLDASADVALVLSTDGEFQLEADQLAIRFPNTRNEFPQTGLWGYRFAVRHTPEVKPS